MTRYQVPREETSINLITLVNLIVYCPIWPWGIIYGYIWELVSTSTVVVMATQYPPCLLIAFFKKKTWKRPRSWLSPNVLIFPLTTFSCYQYILANCSYLIGTVPILTQEKGRKNSDFIMCSYFCKNLPVVMYRKFRNVPNFKDIPPICSYFLGFRIGKYANTIHVFQFNFILVMFGCISIPQSVFFCAYMYPQIWFIVDTSSKVPSLPMALFNPSYRCLARTHTPVCLHFSSNWMDSPTYDSPSLPLMLFNSSQ